jgi:hypothetical protein
VTPAQLPAATPAIRQSHRPLLLGLGGPSSPPWLATAGPAPPPTARCRAPDTAGRCGCRTAARRCGTPGSANRRSAGARTSVVGLGPAAATAGLVDPRAGQDGDLPGPARLPAAHEVPPPLAWLPGSDEPTTQAGTAKPEPHRGSTVLPRRSARRARAGAAGESKPQRPSHLHRGASNRPVVSCPPRVGLTRPATKSSRVRWRA